MDKPEINGKTFNLDKAAYNKGFYEAHDEIPYDDETQWDSWASFTMGEIDSYLQSSKN